MTFLQNSVNLPFADRRQSGRLLGRALKSLTARNDTIVLALPRGGVPVAAEVARAIDAPMFVFVVRKLGVPGQKELGMGAVTSGGRTLINRAVTGTLKITPEVIDSVIWREKIELERREHLYSRGVKMPDLKDKIVILVDDGIATGSTMMLAVQAVKAQKPGRIVVAVPVAPAAAVSQLEMQADEVICLAEPEPFVAVGAWYKDFSEVSDREVCTILDDMLERKAELEIA